MFFKKLDRCSECGEDGVGWRQCSKCGATWCGTCGEKMDPEDKNYLCPKCRGEAKADV